MATTFTRFPSPLGELVLTSSDTALTGVFFPLRRHGPAPEEQPGWVENDDRGPAGAVLAPARPDWHRISTTRVGRLARHPVLHDYELRRAGAPPRRLQRDPRRRRGERQKPDSHHRAVPPGGRIAW